MVNNIILAKLRMLLPICRLLESSSRHAVQHADATSPTSFSKLFGCQFLSPLCFACLSSSHSGPHHFLLLPDILAQCLICETSTRLDAPFCVLMSLGPCLGILVLLHIYLSQETASNMRVRIKCLVIFCFL